MTDAARPLSFDDVVDCYAVPGADNIIDVIHPMTGLTVYGHKTADDMKAEHPDAVRMKLGDFCAAKAERQHAPVTWSSVPESQYREMLEVLPPAMWSGGAFLVGEPDDHDAETGAPRFQAYRQTAGGECFVASRPMTRAELKAFLNQKGIAK